MGSYRSPRGLSRRPSTYARTPAKPKHIISRDGFVVWRGGSCPVSAETLIDVIMADLDDGGKGRAMEGEILFKSTAAGVFCGKRRVGYGDFWQRSDCDGDILAYRICRI